jgi:lipid II:glycine glycyltransferase (peptidoglycan interpeptide bridge formation enzyme)
MVDLKFLDRELPTTDISSFISEHPRKNIFQSLELFEVYKTTVGFAPFLYAVANSKNSILATVSGVLLRNYSWPLSLFTSRAIIQGGPLIHEDDPQVLDFLLKKLNTKLSRKAIYCQFRNLWSWGSNKQIFLDNGFRYEAHLDIVQELSKPPERLMEQMDRSPRRNIRKAQKSDVLVREISNIEEVKQSYKILKSTYRKVNLPCPHISLFVGAFEAFSDTSNIIYLIATHNGEIIGTRIALCYNGLIYDWYAGFSAKHFKRFPNEMLVWKLMEWGSLNGYRCFDFGGAGKPGIPYGVRDFKLRFGGRLVENGRFETIHQPVMYTLGRAGLKVKRTIRH